MGATQSVYMANASGKKIWVLIALKPDWAIFDVFVDVAALLVAAGELKLIVTIKLLWASIGAATRPADAVLSMIEAFKSVSSAINEWDAPDVSTNTFLNYLNADGFASLFGAKTLNVMVMTDEGDQFAWYDSGPDQSWVATEVGTIVRSKYGTIWQQVPDAGEVPWPLPPSPPPPPPPPGQCSCGGNCPWRHGPVGCLCAKDNCSCI